MAVVVGVEGNNLMVTEKSAKFKKEIKLSVFESHQTKGYGERNLSGRYSEFRPLTLPHKNNEIKSNYKIPKAHFPVAAHSYLSPAYNFPSAFRPYAPPSIPKKTQSYDRPSSVYPIAYYTESPTYDDYRAPTNFHPEHSTNSADRPSYPSIFYDDLNKMPGSYNNHVSAETVYGDVDFPEFDDFLKQSLSFQHFRP